MVPARGGSASDSVSSPFHSTTVLAVRREGKTTLAADGQVTLGDIVVKHGARKLRRMCEGAVLAGFAEPPRTLRRCSPNSKRNSKRIEETWNGHVWNSPRTGARTGCSAIWTPSCSLPTRTMCSCCRATVTSCSPMTASWRSARCAFRHGGGESSGVQNRTVGARDRRGSDAGHRRDLYLHERSRGPGRGLNPDRVSPRSGQRTYR